MEPAAKQIQPLSRSALEALVAPYALYSDAVVERVLDAAQYPTVLREAAQSASSANRANNWPDSIQWVSQQPDLLKQLNHDIALTARLGIAARQQLEETWRAVDSVRQRMEAAQAGQSGEQQPGEETATASGSAAAVVPVVPYSGAVAAALWTDAVVHELQEFHQAYHNAHGTTASTQGQTTYGSATVGNTTYYGATGSGTVTGPEGNSATASGQVTGTVTQNGNTTTFQSNATGSVQTNLGYGGTATRSGQGSVTQNSDGSLSFQQSAQGTVNGNQSSGSYSHSSSGTVTGDGNGNYQGNTTVQTQQGTVSTATTGGDGQLSTTVEGPNGSNTYTLGDGQIGGTASSTDPANARMSGQPSATERSGGTAGQSPTSAARVNDSRSLVARPQSVPGDARFQGWSARRGSLGAGNADRAARSK